jgi:hypothetical protein
MKVNGEMDFVMVKVGKFGQMEATIKGSFTWINVKDKEISFMPMDRNIQVSLSIRWPTVKEHLLGLMALVMKALGKIINNLDMGWKNVKMDLFIKVKLKKLGVYYNGER